MEVKIKKSLRFLAQGLPRQFQRQVAHTWGMQNPATYGRDFEHIALRQAFDHLKPDIIFDIGANSGQYYRMLRNQVGFRGKVVCVEPIPEMIPELTAATNGDPNVVIEECAIASEEGYAEFSVMESNDFSTLSKPIETDTDRFREANRVDRTISVPTKPLGKVMEKWRKEFGSKRPYVKLDTQGFDVEIVRSSEHAIRECIAFQSELSFKRIYEHSVRYDEAIRYFESLGFHLVSLIPSNPNFPELIEMDCVMINASNL